MVELLDFGYMPGIDADLLFEIEFVKQYFDFIEITPKLDLSIYTREYIDKIKRKLNNLKVLGHIHWELTDMSTSTITKIKRTIEILKALGAEKVTIHPFEEEGLSVKETKRENVRILSDILEFCKSRGIQLLVENLVGSLFNNAYIFKELTERIPDLGITLDIGHANRVSESEVNAFFDMLGNKIQHIHMHYNIGDKDHLPFQNRDEIVKLLKKIRSIGFDNTITLEIFNIIKNNEIKPVVGIERHRLLLQQLNMIKKIHRILF